MCRSDCTVVFIHESHSAYRWVNRVLARMGISIMWVQDRESAMHLVETADVAMILSVGGDSSRRIRRLFDRVRRVAPRVRQLSIQLPRQGAGPDHPVVSALKHAMYVPGDHLLRQFSGERFVH